LQFGALTQTTVTKIWHKLARTFHLHRNKWTLFGPIATYRLLNPAKFCHNILRNAGIFTNKTTTVKIFALNLSLYYVTMPLENL
jgi:hypothetical protein